MKKLSFTSPVFKKRIVCLAVGLCALGLSSCGDDYDDTELRNNIENLGDRVATLEEWQKSINTNIQSLQSLVAALENKNYITNVAAATENGKEIGYLITFQDGKSITIKHGKDGADGKDGEDGKDGNDGAPGSDGNPGSSGSTPTISIKEVNGVYYWIVNGEFLKDNGNNIPVTGEKGSDAVAPQVQINSDNEWEVSKDGGKTWEELLVNGESVKATGEKGDAFFEDVNTDDPNSVIFILADGDEFTVPRVSALKIAFDNKDDVLVVAPGNNEIKIIFTGVTEERYKGLTAELKIEDNMTAIATKTGSDKYVTIATPTFTKGKCEGTTVTVDGTELTGKKATLKVTLIDSDNQEISISRIVQGTKAVAGQENLTQDDKGNYYVTSDEGIEAAMDLSEKNINVILKEDVTLNANSWKTAAAGGDKTETITIDGDGHTITFKLLDSDWSNVTTTNDEATLVIKNAKIASSGYNTGHWSRAGVNFNCKVQLYNVESQAIILWKDAELGQVTINDSDGYYALWIKADGQTVNIDGLTINAGTGGSRAIAIKDENVNLDEEGNPHPVKVTLNLSNAKIASAKKAAILVTSTAGADITLNNVDITKVEADPTNAVWVDSDREDFFELVTVKGGEKKQEE